MNSETQIGNVTKYLLITTDNLGNKQETTINTNLIPNSEATYGAVDEAFRAITAMTTNSYQDVICVTNISTSAIMAG